MAWFYKASKNLKLGFSFKYCWILNLLLRVIQPSLELKSQGIIQLS